MKKVRALFCNNFVSTGLPPPPPGVPKVVESLMSVAMNIMEKSMSNGGAGSEEEA